VMHVEPQTVSLFVFDSSKGSQLYNISLGPNSNPWGEDIALNTAGNVVVTSPYGANRPGLDNCAFAGFDATSGVQLWEKTFSNCSNIQDFILVLGPDIIVSLGDQLARMNSATGDVVFLSPPIYPGKDLRCGAPVIVANSIFRTCSICDVTCTTFIKSYDATTGLPILSTKIEMSVLFTPLTYEKSSDILFGVDPGNAGGTPSGTSAFSVQTGAEQYFVSTQQWGPWFGGVLAVCSPGFVFFEHPIAKIEFQSNTGKKLFLNRQNSTEFIRSNIASSGDGIVYRQHTTQTTFLSAVNCSTGNELWRQEIPYDSSVYAPYSSQIIIGNDGSVFVMSAPSYITKIVQG